MSGLSLDGSGLSLIPAGPALIMLGQSQIMGGTGGTGSRMICDSGGTAAETWFNAGTGITFAVQPDGSTTISSTAPATQAQVVQTNPSGFYTWTFATPFGIGVVPIVECIAEGPNPAGSSSVNVQIVGSATNTSVSFQVVRSTSAIQVLGINVLSIVTPIATTLHMTARAP